MSVQGFAHNEGMAKACIKHFTALCHDLVDLIDPNLPCPLFQRESSEMCKTLQPHRNYSLYESGVELTLMLPSVAER